MTRKFLGLLGVVGSATLAQVAGVPLDSPALHVAASAALAWLSVNVLALTERVARLEGRAEGARP